MRHAQITVALLLVVSGTVLSCADAMKPGQELDTSQQSVEVVPEFRVTGTAKLPDRLVINDLGLAISSIELTPVTSSERGIAYASGDPIQLDFNVGAGQRMVKSRQLVLPEPGTYDVSVRLEPIAGTSPKPYSLRMSGHVSGGTVTPDIDTSQLGQHMEGQPVPLPLDDDDDVKSPETQSRSLEDKPDKPTQWKSFAFHSERSVEHRLNQVELKAGRQSLRFNVDVHDWALELVDPVMQAAEQDSASEGNTSDDSVDASRQISSRGEGPAGVGEHMSVSTQPTGF